MRFSNWRKPIVTGMGSLLSYVLVALKTAAFPMLVAFTYLTDA